ncbi:hypothetical protein GQ53DRAFT_764748 [Thozetella sp. PMI_491]|nr:hypothetical protein GQ53DRAFT_764748 [Thozetella sp. PMI_491]
MGLVPPAVVGWAVTYVLLGGLKGAPGLHIGNAWTAVFAGSKQLDEMFDGGRQRSSRGKAALAGDRSVGQESPNIRTSEIVELESRRDARRGAPRSEIALPKGDSQQ